MEGGTNKSRKNGNRNGFQSWKISDRVNFVLASFCPLCSILKRETRCDGISWEFYEISRSIDDPPRTSASVQSLRIGNITSRKIYIYFYKNSDPWGLKI